MKNKTAFSLLFFFICFFICFLSINENLFAQKRKTPPRRTVVGTPQKILTVKPTRDLPPEMQRRLNAFYFAWETIKNNYFDQTFSGLNWENIKKEYEPRVLNTKTDKQLHDLLQEMINRLNRSHFVVIPPEVYQAIEKAKAKVKAKSHCGWRKRIGKWRIGRRWFYFWSRWKCKIRHRNRIALNQQSICYYARWKQFGGGKSRIKNGLRDWKNQRCRARRDACKHRNLLCRL